MNDPLHTLNQAELAVMFWQAVVDSGLFPDGESVMLENPSTRAVFPCCTLSVPLARPLYMGRAYDISITVEVWADKQLDAVRLFEQLRTELEKLISYTMGQEIVAREDIEAVTTVQVTNKIFDMVAAIVAGKTKIAMDRYEDLLTLKEPPMRILFLIARQFNQILLVKEMMASGNDKSAIASKLKIPPFAAAKLMPQARNFTKEQLAGCVEACVETEEAVKTGRLGDRLAVELLIMRKY